jgi:hypothetical protein
MHISATLERTQQDYEETTMAHPIDEATAKTAGAARGVKARFNGLVGVFTQLAKEHGEAKHLLQRAMNTSDAEKQRELWRKLRAELLSHERAELIEVYDVLDTHAELAQIVARHQKDAREFEVALEAVDSASYGTSDWNRAVGTLEALVSEHARVEEEDFFPRACDVLGKQAVQALEQPYQTRKAAVMAELGAV